MKYAIVIGLMLFALCACDKEGGVRVIEMESGKFTVQIYDGTGDWKWISKDGNDWYGVGTAIKHGGLMLFHNKSTACDYKEALENQTRIKRIVECE